MVTYRVMSMEERGKINHRVCELYWQGKEEEALAVAKTRPLSPYLAKMVKEMFGADFLRNLNWNLSEAEAEYGPGWLDR